MNWLLRLINRLLQRFGLALLDKETINELVRMSVAYRAVLLAQLDPGQVIVYDKDTCEVRIEKLH